MGLVSVSAVVVEVVEKVLAPGGWDQGGGSGMAPLEHCTWKRVILKDKQQGTGETAEPAAITGKVLIMTASV